MGKPQNSVSCGLGSESDIAKYSKFNIQYSIFVLFSYLHIIRSTPYAILWLWFTDAKLSVCPFTQLKIKCGKYLHSWILRRIYWILIAVIFQGSKFVSFFGYLNFRFLDLCVLFAILTIYLHNIWFPYEFNLYFHLKFIQFYFVCCLFRCECVCECVLLLLFRHSVFNVFILCIFVIFFGRPHKRPNGVSKIVFNLILISFFLLSISKHYFKQITDCQQLLAPATTVSRVL